MAKSKSEKSKSEKSKSEKSKSDAKVPKNRAKSVKLPSFVSDQVADCRYPLTLDATGVLATELAEFQKCYAEWRVTAKAALSAGNEVTPFKGKVPNINKGRLTRSQYEKLVDQAAEDASIIIPPRYNPVEVDAIIALGCSHVCKSTGEIIPKDWDEKKYGSWFHVDSDGNRTVPSSWEVREKAPRRCHSKNVLSLVSCPDGKSNSDNPNVVTVGKTRYVVGGGKSAESSIFLVNAQREGSNYGDVTSTIKRMSLAGVAIANLVFRIEDNPNFGGAVKVTLSGKYEVCFMPGQAMTAGFLTNGDGNPLTPAAVRKLTDSKGIKFKPVNDLVGKGISWSEGLFPEISKIDKSYTDESSQRNAFVMSRTNPCTEAYPFGFRAVQIGIVPFYVKDVSGDFDMGVVVGCRDNYEYNTTMNEAKAEAKAAEVAKAVKPNKSKPKTKTEAKPKLKIAPSEPQVVKVEDSPEVSDVDVDIDVDVDVDSEPVVESVEVDSPE